MKSKDYENKHQFAFLNALISIHGAFYCWVIFTHRQFVQLQKIAANHYGLPGDHSESSTD